MITQNDHERQTLQQYLQTYNIRKKIEQRKRSKSKGKDPIIKSEQEQRVNGIFANIDKFLKDTKVQLQDILINTEIVRDKIFFYLCKLLDDLVLKLKEEVSQMYKDVYRHYLIQSQQGAEVHVNKQAEDYFKGKMVNAIEQKKRSNMGEVIRENFKKEEKNAFITKLILGEHIAKDSPPAVNNNSKSNSGQKQPKERKENQGKKKTNDRQQKPKSNQGKKPKEPETATNTANKQEAPQPRMNSFFEALLGFAQQNPNPSPPAAASPTPTIQISKPPELKPLTSKQRQLPSQKGSKISRPFQRKTSVKEIMNSPKGKKMFKAGSPYY